MIVSNEIKAEVIELFMCYDIKMKELSRLYNIPHKQMSSIIYRYYGYKEQNQYGLKSKV